MKTSTTFSLPLQWICNQRSNFRQIWKNHYLQTLLALIIVLFVLPVNPVFADQLPDAFSNYMAIKPYDDSNRDKKLAAVSIQLVIYDTDGYDERAANATNLSYSIDGGITYVDLFTYGAESAIKTDINNIYYYNSSGSATKGYLIDKKVKKVGDQYYLFVDWFYPASVAGKEVKFRVKGPWIKNSDQNKPITVQWNKEKSVQLNKYEPATTFKLNAVPDGNYNFEWTGATANISGFEIYSDKDFTKFVRFVNNNTMWTNSGSELVKLGLFKDSNTYYVKQVYSTLSYLSGISLFYEKKFAEPLTHVGYKYPKDVSCKTVFEKDPLKIELSITEGNIASNFTAKYYIKRDGVLITENGLTGLNYTDVNVEPLKEYTYVVYSVPDSWDKNIVIPELSKTIISSTIPPVLKFDKFTIEGVKGTNRYIKLSWEKDGSIEWYEPNTVKLERKNKTTNEWDDLGILEKSTNYNDFDEIEEFKYYNYRLTVNQWGRISTKYDSAYVSEKVSFTKKAATKNTYGDRINLQWTIDRLDLCKRFEIYRSFAITDAAGGESWSEDVLIHQFSTQTLVNSWDDRDAAPGILYKYKIVAIKETENFGDQKVETTDIGFRMPTGVVTGRVTYGSGTAVEGTSIYISSSSESGGEVLYKSLKFNEDASQGGKVNLTKSKHGCIAGEGFTFQAWLQPLTRKAVASTIFEVEKEYSIRMNNDNILVLMGNPLQQVRSYKLETTIAENSFFHLGVAYSSEKKLKIFINGVAKDSITLANTYTCAFTESTKCYIANNTTDDVASRLPYNGRVDDVRLWNKGISNVESLNNYNRYLGGSELGLIGYWPMDEGIGNYAFDCSKTDKVFNENHIVDIKRAVSENTVPTKEQLSIKGVTDVNGNYIIRGIPFIGDGSTYSITPLMGTHKFEPKQQLRYVSPTSLVHNGTDFSDKSSFPVTVTVKYKNTDYPVEGVSFSIDNNPVSKENKMVVTDKDGIAIIDVPIGEHYINATLVGHEFDDEGRYPSIGKFIVTGEKPIVFTDKTLVSITGRVAGGLLEAAKPVGFNKGNANIGQAIIQLKPAGNSLLNKFGNDKRSLNEYNVTNIKSESHAITIDGSNYVEIITDPEDGEYFVKLPPIKEWKVTSVKIYKNGTLDADLVEYTNKEDYINKSIIVNPLITAFDTLTLNGKLDSLKYNVKQDFIYRVKPTIKITDLNTAETGAFGDKIYVIKNADPTKNEEVSLYQLDPNKKIDKYTFGNVNVGDVEYPDGKPVFTMGKTYDFKIEAYEEYINRKVDDSGNDATEYNKVPLAGAAVTVDNEMGKLFRPKASTAADVETPKHEMLLNKEGYVKYRFLVGFPRLSDIEQGMGMNVKINYNNIETEWEKNNKFRGIVLGYEPVAGANFKTRGPGPLVPLVVLRDPPGSNSYAYMEKGTEIAYSMTHKHTLEGSFSVENKLKFGTVLETSIGLGFTVTCEIKAEDDLTIGLSGEYSSFTGDVNENKLTLKERIQTSGSPDFVGSIADVYIGTSTNVFTTDCKFVEIGMYENKPILINPTRETSDLQTDTEFRLSQYEILNAQIPAWKKTIKSLFLNKTNSALNKYEIINSEITEDEMIESMGKDKDGNLLYTVQFGTNGLGDQVDSAFNQIKNWQNLIKRNEMAKFNAKTSKIFEKTNISFDAGTYIDRSYSFSTKTGTTNGSTSKTQESISNELGLEVNGFGMEITTEQKFGGGRDNESTSTTENSTSFGYVLSDPDTDNRFSVNVYKNKFLSSELEDMESEDLDAEEADATVGSYIFELAAGQTSCPYESSDKTLFYKGHTTKKDIFTGKDEFKSYTDGANLPLKQLSSGSQALDVPFLDISPKERLNVPNGKDAVFTLNLSSNSTGYSPRPYVLSVDETTNKDGAIISVDGTPLTTGRPYYIPKGESLIKTLTVRQSKTDVLNYEGIKLNLSSACGDTTFSKPITVKYVPSCSDLDLEIESLTMNSVTGDKAKLKLRNFDQSYSNFRGIKIQYKLEGEKDWNQKILANTANTANSTISTNSEYFSKKQLTIAKEIPNDVSSLDYELDLSLENDGRYQVRALTICENTTGGGEINNITPEYILVKDMVRPSTLGTPSPSNGILTPEEEIAVTFNEPLQTSRMVETNFEVQGVINQTKFDHSEGLALAANVSAYTEMPISLQKGSFAIEAWVNMTDNQALLGTIFSIGEGANKLSLKMNYTSVALFVNDVQVKTDNIIQKDNIWQYVSLNYDASNNKTEVFVVSSDVQRKLECTNVDIDPDGRLTVGSGFVGKIHQLAVWNVNRSVQDLSDMNYTKTGTERNLVGYWPMNEATGKIAADKVRGRNLIVNCPWFIDPSGKSGEFNGSSSNVVINTTTIPVTAVDNFSLEFWFNGGTQTDATIFSCGKGIDETDLVGKLSIGFNNKGILSMTTKGVSYLLTESSLLDNNWHHFAMSVSRNSNANIFIDGKLVNQIPASKISGLQSAKMTIGSRSYFTNSVLQQDQYFNGKIDEFRIWNTALSSENIRLDMRSALESNSSGLIAYYPFDNLVSETINNSVKVSIIDGSSTKAEAAVAIGLSLSDNNPGIKMARKKEQLKFSYTASDNKIIFTINEPLKKIENCILEFSINQVYDLNGNVLKSPIKWTAFVNNNRLKWVTDQMTIKKEVLAPASFKATIVNNSGKYENYVIDGLPGWLTANKTSGRLNPLEKAELTFTVDNSVNVGSYESSITLTGNNGIQEMFPVSLKVTGPRPDWTVNPYEYESSMNVIGQIKIEGVGQEDTEDVLAAFNGTKCVGIVSPQFDKMLNKYIFYMDVYGDSSKPLTFSLWDAGTGRIYPGINVEGGALTFSPGSIIGSVAVPKVFNAVDKVEQQLNIKKGWSWISTNVDNISQSLYSQLTAGLETSGLVLKTIGSYTEYIDGYWEGSLLSINQKKMYLVRSAESKTIKMIGATAKPTSNIIDINNGWNWIGYIPQFVAPIKEALSSINPVDGDQIKGQVGFATYSGGNWNGSLQYLVPGQGYMFNSNSTSIRHLTYPAQYVSRANVKQISKSTNDLHWTYVDGTYPQSMTATSVVKIDGIEVANTNMQVGVFIDNECRGVYELIYIGSRNRYYAYIQIWGGNADINKNIVFKCFDPTTNKEYTATTNTLMYVPETSGGSSSNPYVINVSATTTDQSDLMNGNRVIYPNPVINTLNFSYNPQGIERFEIVDCTGRTQVLSTSVNKNSLDVSDLIPGIYTLRVNYKGTIYSHRFIKK